MLAEGPGDVKKTRRQKTQAVWPWQDCGGLHYPALMCYYLNQPVKWKVDILREIYADNAATTKPFEQVVQAMVKCLTEEYGNPSSLHRRDKAENMKEAERRWLKRLKLIVRNILRKRTESTTLTAIRGSRSYSNRGNHIISTKAEHPSVLMTLEGLEKDSFDIHMLMSTIMVW